jgi:hypothetical protein
VLPLAFGFFVLASGIGSNSSEASRTAKGHIDISQEKCSFENSIYIYDTPSPKSQKPLGILEDGAKVEITLNPRVKLSYFVEVDDIDGKRRIGYVEKACVVIDEIKEEGPPPPSPPPILRSGYITAFPLDLGEKYEVTIGDKTGTCTATSTKEISCQTGLSDFEAIIASQNGHEFLLGCQFDSYETCVNLPVGTYSITVHGRSVTVWRSGMERINTRTGKKIGTITPVFSILTTIK